MARRDEREYPEYLNEEQRSQPGCPARELCREPRGRDTSRCRDYDVAGAGLGTIICVTVPVLPRRLSTLVIMVVVSTAVAVVAQTPAREAHAALNGVRIWYSATGGRGER